MERNEIIPKLQEVFDRVFLDKVVLTPELSATDVEEWDSLTHVSLLIAVEKTFNIRFKVGEVSTIQNVGQFADLIARHVGQK